MITFNNDKTYLNDIKTHDKFSHDSISRLKRISVNRSEHSASVNIENFSRTSMFISIKKWNDERFDIIFLYNSRLIFRMKYSFLIMKNFIRNLCRKVAEENNIKSLIIPFLN